MTALFCITHAPQADPEYSVDKDAGGCPERSCFRPSDLSRRVRRFGSEWWVRVFRCVGQGFGYGVAAVVDESPSRVRSDVGIATPHVMTLDNTYPSTLWTRTPAGTRKASSSLLSSRVSFEARVLSFARARRDEQTSGCFFDSFLRSCVFLQIHPCGHERLRSQSYQYGPLTIISFHFTSYFWIELNHLTIISNRELVLK